jgi:hypothetical protein
MFFDATTVAPDAGGNNNPIPAGTYLAMITASEMKTTKAGDGQFLKLEFTIIDGEFQARKVFDNLNIYNTNAQAQQIAQARLSAICHAVNILKPMASEQLHNIPLKIVVNVKPASGQYAASNGIKGIESATSSGQAKSFTAVASPVAAAAAKAPATNAPAWAKKA